jgi:hypothetical protein
LSRLGRRELDGRRLWEFFLVGGAMTPAYHHGTPGASSFGLQEGSRRQRRYGLIQSPWQSRLAWAVPSANTIRNSRLPGW